MSEATEKKEIKKELVLIKALFITAMGMSAITIAIFCLMWLC